MIHMIYVMFQSGEVTAGMILFLAGCGMTVLSLLAALFMAATSGRSRKKMNRKMKERYL